MLNATAAILVVPPQMQLNPSPKDPFDLLSGEVTGFHAGLIRDIGFRLTLIPAVEVGACRPDPSNGSVACTGIKRLIADRTVDFSLMEMQFQDQQDPDLAYDSLYHQGPTVYAAESSFLALPDAGASSRAFDMSDTLSFLAPVLSLTLAALTAVLLLVNWSPFKNAFVIRLPLTSIAGMLAQRFAIRVLQPHRRVALLSALFLVLMFQQMFLASLHSSLVLTIPARYPGSLADVAASKRLPLFIGGLNLDVSFRKARVLFRE